MATERTKLEHCTGQHSPADGIPLKIPAATCTGSTASPGNLFKPQRFPAPKGIPMCRGVGTKLRKQSRTSRSTQRASESTARATQRNSRHAINSKVAHTALAVAHAGNPPRQLMSASSSVRMPTSQPSRQIGGQAAGTAAAQARDLGSTVREPDQPP